MIVMLPISVSHIGARAGSRLPILLHVCPVPPGPAMASRFLHFLPFNSAQAGKSLEDAIEEILRSRRRSIAARSRAG